MKKRLTIFLFVIISLPLLTGIGFAADIDDVVDITPLMEQSLDSIDLSLWKQLIDDNEFFGSITNNSSGIKEYIRKLINGEATISFDSFLNAAFSKFTSAFKAHMSIAGLLFGIALISAMLERLLKSTFKGEICAIAVNVLFCCAVGLIIKGFADIISTGMGTVNNMTGFIEKSLPLLMVFVTAIGGTASTQMLQPSVLMIVELTSKIIGSIIIPLLTASAVLSIAYNICRRDPYKELSGSVKKLSDWIIGIMFVLFFGFISIQKLTSSALDGLSIKTIKYTISSFSLYGGSFLSKSFDVVTGCAVLMKNVLGGIGMIILLSICISPALELCAITIVYRFASLLISLTGETRISGCLNDVGKIYGTLFLCVMTCAVLSFMLLSVITVAGNSVLGI